MAAALFQAAVAERGDYAVSSAGVAASKGARCNPETAAILTKRGIAADGFTSRQVTGEMLAAATHVFTMTASHLQMLESRFPEHSDKFYLVCEFVEIPNEGIGADVPDPIGLGRRAYEEVAEMFDVAIPAIIAYIDQTWKPAAP